MIWLRSKMPWWLRRRPGKAEVEVAFLKVEHTSLVLEIGATKEEVSSL